MPEPIDHIWLGCSDFDGFPDMPKCCTSCHYEEEDGYSRMCESYRDHLGCSAIICCAVAGWLGDLTDDQWLAAKRKYVSKLDGGDKKPTP